MNVLLHYLWDSAGESIESGAGASVLQLATHDLSLDEMTDLTFGVLECFLHRFAGETTQLISQLVPGMLF